jgi:Carboxypeptidase regulatory-like domain
MFFSTLFAPVDLASSPLSPPLVRVVEENSSVIYDSTNIVAQVNDVSPSSQPQENTSPFVVFPVGINLGRRNVLQSSFIRGYEDSEKAVNFQDWLISLSDLTTAFNLNLKTLEDGQIELTGVGLIKRIQPEDLTNDPELGLALSVAKIEQLLEVPAQFDIAAYSIIFEPPWLNFRAKRNFNQETPVVVEGLPLVKSAPFTFSTVAQEINLSGNDNQDHLTTQGTFTAIGTILGGSWLTKINQIDLLDSTTWQLRELQYLKQGDFTDLVLGSQPTFWQNQATGDYWGVTAIKRFGFKADNLNGAGFSPSQRLQSTTIKRTIEGRADPGTLVQLVSGYDNLILSQVLVDSLGVYRFENVPISYNGGNYRVLLYPNGQLARTPIEKEATFLNLPGQLTKGTSSLIVSSGLRRKSQTNDFIGELTELRGGFAYRYGVSDSLTLGAGLVKDQSLLGVVDLFFQPNKVPLKLALSALQTPDQLKYNANLQFKPDPKLNMDFYSNELYQSYNFSWNVAQGLSFITSGNNLNNIINGGIALNKNIGKLTTYSSLKIDSNQQWDWYSSLHLLDWNLSAKSNSTNTGLELSYEGTVFNLPGDEYLTLAYETIDSNQQTNDLLTFKWKYRSPYRLSDQRSPWEWELGYGIGSQGQGVLASLSTLVLPGTSLRLRYDGISAVSDTSSFRLEISSAANLNPRFTPGDTRFERLRSEGGIFIQPFLDRNNNGIRDHNEKIYTEELDLLLVLNNQKFNPLYSQITPQGVLSKLPPGVYRLDLDPAGYPVDWKPSQVSWAIEVVPGGYTTVSIPFLPSYTLAGTLTNSQGKPIPGAKIEAIHSDNKFSVVSITNSSGIFYLEQLRQGTYQLKFNGTAIEPNTFTIDENSNRTEEINIKVP